MAVRIADDVLYRYSPARQEMNDMVEAIAVAHYADRDALATLMARGPRHDVRLFADAFRLRKGRLDG